MKKIIKMLGILLMVILMPLTLASCKGNLTAEEALDRVSHIDWDTSDREYMTYTKTTFTVNEDNKEQTEKLSVTIGKTKSKYDGIYVEKYLDDKVIEAELINVDKDGKLTKWKYENGKVNKDGEYIEEEDFKKVYEEYFTNGDRDDKDSEDNKIGSLYLKKMEPTKAEQLLLTECSYNRFSRTVNIAFMLSDESETDGISKNNYARIILKKSTSTGRKEFRLTDYNEYEGSKLIESWTFKYPLLGATADDIPSLDDFVKLENQE